MPRPIRKDLYIQKSFNCSKATLEAMSEIRGFAHLVGFPAITNQSDLFEVALREISAQLKKAYVTGDKSHFLTINEYQ